LGLDFATDGRLATVSYDGSVRRAERIVVLLALESTGHVFFTE